MARPRPSAYTVPGTDAGRRVSILPRMARKIPSLGRFLSAPSLYAMAYGEISSSLYYALGITAVYALSLTPAVFLAAGILFALAAAAYAEGGATIPEQGGSSALQQGHSRANARRDSLQQQQLLRQKKRAYKKYDDEDN